MKKTSTLFCLLAALLIPAVAQAKSEGKGKQLDTNGDGVISKAEVDASGKKRLVENFDKIDANGDGNLTREEMKAHREMAREKGEGKGKGKMKEADTNGDGALSLNEATDAGMKRLVENFGEIDANGDGNLTRDEMKAHRKMARENGEGKGDGKGKGKGKLKEADTDQNGALSIDEASAAGMDKMVENFDKVDLDGDGEISREEMKQARKHLREKKQEGKGSRGEDA